FAIIAGVKFLHEQKIVHLDLKSENILLGDDGYPKIIDFDSAEFYAKLIKETEIGTKVYWSPELKARKKGKEIDGRAADIWALGTTLYQLYTGNYPILREDGAFAGFQGELPEFFRKDQNNNFINANAANVAEVISQLLETEPQQRLKNFADIFNC